MIGRGIDLRERQFGKIVVARVDDEWSDIIQWVCFCKCGDLMVILEEDLMKGEITSCEKCR